MLEFPLFGGSQETKCQRRTNCPTAVARISLRDQRIRHQAGRRDSVLRYGRRATATTPARREQHLVAWFCVFACSAHTPPAPSQLLACRPASSTLAAENLWLSTLR